MSRCIKRATTLLPSRRAFGTDGPLLNENPELFRLMVNPAELAPGRHAFCRCW